MPSLHLWSQWSGQVTGVTYLDQCRTVTYVSLTFPSKSPSMLNSSIICAWTKAPSSLQCPPLLSEKRLCSCMMFGHSIPLESFLHSSFLLMVHCTLHDLSTLVICMCTIFLQWCFLCSWSLTRYSCDSAVLLFFGEFFWHSSDLVTMSYTLGEPRYSPWRPQRAWDQETAF